jgi:hypothetical protein
VPDRIFTVSGSRRCVVKTRLSRPAPVEIRLDVGGGERNAGRAAVHHAAERNPVAFAEGRDAKEMAERVV